MTARMAMVWIRLVMMLVMVLLMAFWAPTTSLLSRLISSPTLVLVKKRSDMRCRRENRAERRSKMTPSPDGGVQSALDHRQHAVQDGDEHEHDGQEHQPVEIFRGQHLVDQRPKDQRRGQREPRPDQDGKQHPAQVTPVRTCIVEDAQQQSPGDAGLLVVRAHVLHPGVVHTSLFSSQSPGGQHVSSRRARVWQGVVE